MKIIPAPKGLLRLFIGVDVLVGQGPDLARQIIFQAVAAVFVAVLPPGGGGRASMEEGDAQLSAGGQGYHGGDEGALDVVVQQHRHPGVLQPVEDLLADLGQLPHDLGGHLLPGGPVAEDLDIHQKGLGDVVGVHVLAEAGVPEHVVEGAEAVDVLGAGRLNTRKFCPVSW